MAIQLCELWLTTNMHGHIIEYLAQREKDSERRKQCALAVARQSQKFSPCQRPVPGGIGRPKCNQLEMVTTFTYKPMRASILTKLGL